MTVPELPHRAIDAMQDAVDALAQWCSQVRRDAHQRLGVAADDPAVSDDPGYQQALKLFYRVDRTLDHIKQATASADAEQAAQAENAADSSGQAAGEGGPSDRRRLCAHADADGRDMHWLEPAQSCPDAQVSSPHALTGNPGLPDAVAPVWVDGYLSGHDRGEEEGRQAGYADYDRQLIAGVAGMLAGDPAVTDYREGVRRHQRMADAKNRRDAIRARDLRTDTDDQADDAADSRPSPAEVAAFIDGTTDAQRHVRHLLATTNYDDEGWEL